MTDYKFKCRECGATFNGETDCLKHANKVGHETFEDPEEGKKDYQPLKDLYLMGELLSVEE